MTRAFLAGLLAALLAAGVVVLVVGAVSDGTEPPPPTTTVDGSAASIVPQYGMPTADGNRAVHTMITLVTSRLRSGVLRDADDVSLALRTGVRAVARAGYDNVFDRRVREAIFDALWPSLQRAGIDPTKVSSTRRRKR